MVPEFLATLKDNQFFGAGFGLVGVGTLLALLRRGSQHGVILFKRYYMTTMEVTSRDKSYPWVLQWLNDSGRITQHISVNTNFQQTSQGQIETQFNFVPSPGFHHIFYKNTWIQVERNRENQMTNLQTGSVFESVKLTAFGRKQKLFSDILTNAKDKALEVYEGKTILYVPAAGEWRPFGRPMKKRPITSVSLDKSISEEVLNDLKGFISNSTWYSDRGIPYRRGYLFYGPPGCGKSSFITALAGELGYGICLLSLSEQGMSDDRLIHLMSVTPPQTIILLEDIDVAFKGRDLAKENPQAYKGMGSLTLSGLLNALDGVTPSEGRIVFMTTNYADRLDSALVRPGRVDMHQEIKHCTDYQLDSMFSRFYPNCSLEQRQNFINIVRKLNPNRSLSPAEVQGYFMLHKHDPEDAIKNADHISKS